MTKVEIYTTSFCPYCTRTKALLKSKNVDFIEYDLLSDFKLKAKMIKRSEGARSVPQIFINNEHIGGNNDLYALEASGALDAML